MAKEIAEEYASSLEDLTVNSKPLINMLTMLAEENLVHAGVIVETVEKHLEKVPPEIKLPVLYLVDSIIKNVGKEYVQKFSASIVNMFTRTFKQVDEKIRSQMFKLRETWHDVFPATKLYQLDVKVNLIDPAWPIQAQPQQSTIHVNPNFLKKGTPTPTTSVVPTLTEEEEKMRRMLAKKEQELLMLQQRKIEMELEQTRRQLEMAEKNVKKVTELPPAPLPEPLPAPQPARARLGPPVPKSSSNRITPVSAAMVAARRDPRLLRGQASAPPAPHVPPAPIITPNLFDIKPLARPGVLTIDVEPRPHPRRDNRDPRLARVRRPPPEPIQTPAPTPSLDKYIESIPDVKKINKLPPIRKINREERKDSPSPVKRKKETARPDKKKKRETNGNKDKDGSSSSSPEKKSRNKTKEERRNKAKEKKEEPTMEPEVVPFKELRNYHKERYMRRNRQPDSPEPAAAAAAAAPAVPADPAVPVATNIPDVLVENKDVDLRVLPAVDKPATVTQKRSSTEAIEVKPKKSKIDKFDILFGNEDVDLRQLPQVEEIQPVPVSPKLTNPENPEVPSPPLSPKKDWNEVKAKNDSRKTPSKLDLVRAKLAEATKGKDNLGRPLLFSKSPSVEKERRRTMSAEDTDLRTETTEEFDSEDHKKTINIIMTQAKEKFTDGEMDKNQYNALMYQVLQLNEKLKLKEAKQRESLEKSKLKLKAHITDENKVISPKSSPNTFGDIDERMLPPPFMEAPESQPWQEDSDMRVNMDPNNGPMRNHPRPPMFMAQNNWRGPRPNNMEEFGPRRFRGPVPPFMRGKFDNRGPRGPMRGPLLPAPQIGMAQGESPLVPYVRSESPPPIGAPGFLIPPTDYRILEYIDQDPVKTIQIDGIPREIRFYGDTAIIMLDWDDPREITFLPGSRRVTFDNKDSVVLSFNEPYKKVEIDDQVFDIRFGAPTRELYINGRWFECYFGGQPLGVIIDGKPRLVQPEGPLPQVDIGKMKRTDLVAGKINLIVNATIMCPVYLDAKVQKFCVDGNYFTLRFVDALQTVLINEQPFKVEYGSLPKPISVGNKQLFIRFSTLPKNVKPGLVQIEGMEGVIMPIVPSLSLPPKFNAMEVDHEPQRPPKTPSPDGENQGLEMLASVMTSNVETPASASAYCLAEPLFGKPDKIPGLEAPADEKQLPILGNINVSDLFAKLVATGIVPMPNDKEKEAKEPKEDPKAKPKEDKTVLHKVDLLRPETLKVKQPAVVASLYGGMQCSGCGARFPPEHTVRYSQHLDWHFRQNRRDRDSARRAHSRHWHYDLADWLQYEELEDLEEREKSWFESGEAEGTTGPPAPVSESEAPSVAAGAPQEQHCALCGDTFHQFYNEDHEEWHLRNSVTHEGKNYHPICFDDYMASLTKEDPPKEQIDQQQEDTVIVDKVEAMEAIELDETAQSDNESEVELIEPDEKIMGPVEIVEADDDEEIDDDDVVLKAEPVEQVDVDDGDTDDETSTARAQRDFDYTKVKVKQEPVDPDDEPIITSEEPLPIPVTSSGSAPTPQSSIDGNVQLQSAPTAPTVPTNIRINISKPLPTPAPAIISEYEDISVDDEPLPPGEEPELQYTIKKSLEGVQFSRQPPVQKGSELSGLCSIM